jgi:transposase
VVAAARNSDASMAQLAGDFGISESCLARWLKIADRQDGLGDRPGGRRSSGQAAAAPAEAGGTEQRLRQLERRNRQLEQENEVLRRATAYLARDVLPK